MEGFVEILNPLGGGTPWNRGTMKEVPMVKKSRRKTYPTHLLDMIGYVAMQLTLPILWIYSTGNGYFGHWGFHTYVY